MWMKSLALLLFLSLLPGEKDALKQGKKGKEKTPPSPQVKIDPSIKGNFNYEVCIRLVNGGRIYGVVLHGNLFEKLEKRHFISLKDHRNKRAGVRLWYVNDQKGYVFISYRDILEISRVRVLTEEELRRLLERLVEKEKAAKEARKKAAEALEKKKLENEDTSEDVVKKDKEEKENKELEKMEKLIEKRLALFEKFHPQQGWTPDKKKVLKWKGPVIGVYPNKEEQEFLDNYEEWVVIYKEWKKENDKTEKEDKDKKNEEGENEGEEEKKEN